MRKKLLNTKVTVKLRKSEYKEEWYLIVEAYPVYDPCNPKHKRVVESINRVIRTPIWDKSSVIGITPDGDYKYRPKRDVNGVILCSSKLDQESCIYADEEGNSASMSTIVLSSIQTRRQKYLHRTREVSKISSNTLRESSISDTPIVLILL